MSCLLSTFTVNYVFISILFAQRNMLLDMPYLIAAVCDQSSPLISTWVVTLHLHRVLSMTANRE